MRIAGTSSEEISEGSTDKWWMDRWQIEALAVASARDLTLEEACNLLTTAYFGTLTGRIQQLLAGLSCIILTVGTFLAAWYTNWSWISQFFVLSCLGYFVNRTASLRGWRFEPAHALRRFTPKIRKQWPTQGEMQDGGGVVRIAVQSSGVGHLRGIIVIPGDLLDPARQEAQTKKGRYRTSRKRNEWKLPYGSGAQGAESHWISFESQASFYGLLASVVPDNVERRSIGVIFGMFDGILLMVLGFGASIPKGWSGYVLLFFLAGIGLAIFGRSRETEWTLPEFAKVDFTADPMEVPLTARERVRGMRGTESLPKVEVCDLNLVSMTSAF
jgi:hypothetical protein